MRDPNDPARPLDQSVEAGVAQETANEGSHFILPNTRDDQTIAWMYYTASGKVLAISASDGKPQELRAGDFLTVDPYRGDLIVLSTDRTGSRLVRVPLAGGAEHAIPVQGDARLAVGNLHPTAVAPDGRILVPATLRSSWFGLSGVLGPQTGRIEIVRTAYDADL